MSRFHRYFKKCEEISAKIGAIDNNKPAKFESIKISDQLIR